MKVIRLYHLKQIKFMHIKSRTKKSIQDFDFDVLLFSVILVLKYAYQMYTLITTGKVVCNLRRFFFIVILEQENCSATVEILRTQIPHRQCLRLVWHPCLVPHYLQSQYSVIKQKTVKIKKRNECFEYKTFVLQNNVCHKKN